MNNIDDAAPDWIIGRVTSAAILTHIHTNFDYLPHRLPQEPAPSERRRLNYQKHVPVLKHKKSLHLEDDLSMVASQIPYSDDSVLAHDWSAVKLLEEHDPNETTYSSRPYAYVADHVVRIDLGASVTDEMTKYERLARTRKEGRWFERLRDELQMDAAQHESIGWYVVVCGDEERLAPERPSEESNFGGSLRESTYDSYNYNEEPARSFSTASPPARMDRPLTAATLGPGRTTSRDYPKGYSGDYSVGRTERPTTPGGSGGTRNKDYTTPERSPRELRNGNGNEPHQQPSLRHKISRAAGLRRFFGRKDEPMPD